MVCICRHHDSSDGSSANVSGSPPGIPIPVCHSLSSNLPRRMDWRAGSRSAGHRIGTEEVSALYFFMAPTFTLALADPVAQVGTGLFALTGIFVAIFGRIPTADSRSRRVSPNGRGSQKEPGPLPRPR